MPRKRQSSNANLEPMVTIQAKTAKKSELIIDQLQNKNEALEILPNLSGEEIQALLAQGGTGKDLLNVLHCQNEEKLKAPEISVVFTACQAFFLHLTEKLENCKQEEEVQKFKKLGVELCRELLEDHIGYIILLLSGSNTVYQAKSSLRLLTSMVTFHHQTAREVMSKLDFEHKHWESISKRTNSREIREAFVQFLLSFFIINHPGVAKDFLEKKNLLASIFPGLTKDDAQLVQLILTSFKEKVLENSALSKTSKMKLFSVHNLKYVLRLYDDWTGAYLVADLESDEYLQNKVDVIEVVNDFLLAACTSSKHGLVFQDPSYGTSGSNMNHLLLNFLHSMAEPWTNPTLANLVIRSLSTCPDQIRPYFSKTIQPLWQPRASPAWYQVIDFLHAILQGLDVDKILDDVQHTKMQITVVCNFLVNDKIFKEIIQVGIQSNQEHVVKVKVLEFLHMLLSKLEPVLMTNKSVAKQILFRLQDKLPSIQDLVSVWHNELERCQADENNQMKYLPMLTEILSFYLKHFTERYSNLQDLDLQNMLEKASAIDKTEGLVCLQLLHHLSGLASFSISQNNILTLLRIACKYFDSSHGNLALQVLFTSLTKSHLSFDVKELQVWLGLVPATEIEQLCQILSESLMSLLERKDTICDDIKEEMRISPISPFSDKRTQELLNALIDKDETDELMITTDFQISPLLWTLVKSKPLQNDFKLYFQKCILATIVCESDDVESLLEHLLAIPDFDIFNSKQEVTQMLSDAGQQVFGEDNPHMNFIQGLKNRQLLTIFKLSGNNDALKELLDQDNLKNLALDHDQDILRHFDPMDWNESSGGKFWLNQVILKVFKGPGTMDCNFSGKMLKILGEALLTTEAQPNETFESLFRAMSMSAKESKNLLSQVITSTRINKFTVALLDLTLEKVFVLDKWSLMSDDLNVIFLADVVEQVLLDEDSLRRPTLLSKCQDLFKLNKGFLQKISATHLSLACQQRTPSSIAFVQAILELNFEAYGSHVQKWIKNQIHLCCDDGVNLLHPLIKQILAKDKCKRHFKTKVAQRILSSSQPPNQGNLELLEMLVVNHQFDLSEEDQEVLPACQALFEHFKRKGDEDSILSKVILPLMNQCVKEVKSGQNLTNSSCKLLSKCLKDFNGKIEEDVTKFAKNMLKYSLRPEKDETRDDEALLALCGVCEKSSDQGIQDMIYALITGHSQFIPIMLSSEMSSKKVPLLKLILTLLKQDPSLCSSLQVPIYLGAYNASLSQVDQLLLEILQIHEIDASVSFQAFKPMVWGTNAIAKYSVLSQARQVSASKTSKVSEILALFHPERMFNSALHCPNRFSDLDNTTLYDPRFVLPLICQLCSPNRFVDKHLKLIESGALAMAFASLSCRQEPIRNTGLVALQRIYDQFQKAKKSLSAEKQIWLHLLDIVRNGLIKVSNDNGERVTTRLPHITTSFLIHVTKILSNPLDTMFKSISHFILAKPLMELFTVPEFLRLFHSSSVTHHSTEQEWILSIIGHGIKDELDYSILQQNFIPKMLMSFYDAGQQVQSKSKQLILNIFLNVCRLPSAASDLVRNHGFLFWLAKIQPNRQVVAILKMVSGLKWSQWWWHQMVYLIVTLIRETENKHEEADDESAAIQLYQVLKDVLLKIESSRVVKNVSDQIWHHAVSLSSEQVDRILVDIWLLNK